MRPPAPDDPPHKSYTALPSCRKLTASENTADFPCGYETALPPAKAKQPLPAPPQDCEKNSSASTADRPPNVQTYSSAQNRTQTAPGRQFRGIPASGCPDDFLPCFHSPFRLPIFQYTHIPHFCLFLTQICFHTKIEKPLTTLSFVRSLLFC